MSDPSSGAVYHHVSPTVAIAYKVVSGLTLLFTLISVLMSLIQAGVVSPSFFLLTMNLLLTSGLVGNLWWWYKSGEISEDRVYLMFAALGIMAFQCLATDIWVFDYRLNPQDLIPGTVSPVTHHTAQTIWPNETTKVTIQTPSAT